MAGSRCDHSTVDVTTLLLAALTAVVGLVAGLALGRGGAARALAERDTLRAGAEYRLGKVEPRRPEGRQP